MEVHGIKTLDLKIYLLKQIKEHEKRLKKQQGSKPEVLFEEDSKFIPTNNIKSDIIMLKVLATVVSRIETVATITSDFAELDLEFELIYTGIDLDKN